MDHPFIVYLKNKTSLEFEYKRDISTVVRTENGYRITFNNGGSYNYGAEKVQYYSLVSRRESVHIYENGELNKKYNTVYNYGRYLIFRNGESCSSPIENNSNIEICDIEKNIGQTKSVINYFKEILKESGEVSFDIPSEETDSQSPNQISSDILLKALDGIDVLESGSALSNYINGINPALSIPKETLIYPFGCNTSQKLAVETTLRNSISIVEGPPGTGKTQTILNIIANLIVQNKTVAIVSNNNTAVFNVREKLEKYGYEMIVASLGNKDNKALFFDNIDEQTVNQDFKISEERLTKAMNEVRDLDSILMKCFEYRNKLATLKTKLSDAELEFNHIKAEQPLNQHIKFTLDKKFHRKWNFRKALNFKKLLSAINLENKLSIINKLRFVLQYGLFDLNSISQRSEELPVYVNHKFYELYIAKIKNEILDIENWLAANNEEANLKNFIETSKEVFNGVLFEKYNRLDKVAFNVKNYRNQFDDFTKRYPVILSSTLSLHTSTPKGYLFDYLIIDESSQVDIIKSAVCFSCCRNVVVVGDSMQLTHIIDKQSKEAAERFRIDYNISPAYDYVKQNILNSLKSLYRDKVKSVLLKEHYRCHPAIIGFCNKKYYNNQLVIMTYTDNHPFRIIETNISGGKGNYNQRQIDETDFYIRKNYAADYTKVGVVTPYRDHAVLLQKLLPSGAEADTIHKFQGREKDVIIFNTVKNKIGTFIDNPNLINVAVSRAVKEFIVVKPASMDLPHGTNIGDLIRYICYITDPAETIIKGSICSVFDLLYKEYNKAFIKFILSKKNVKGSAAELIIDKLLSENVLLNNTQFSSIDMVREYRLRDLIQDFQLFSEDEIGFIRNNSRIDFLLYNKIDKSPVLAIEVDGVSFHDKELQQQRDSKKNHILKTIGLPLLRLSTDGHSEEKRIIESLSVAMGLR
ncbi:superfamily I DNA and/or RNA helicase [Pedobacter cryoconitis]|uniref:Superfamily I DNA and/or RNA helicase n=1 Tax=Pedobacter cryoconitis TaxID=188932 RepID=A0A7W8YPH1_9SPHI|nr:AAA domain-containing protein [Pedobacter cryoconitis]MBB5619309.1 superfamily I DNA and/or RNA helicase [Pedobacter cryoconitis]